jgi:hypothetical protein
MRSYVECEAAWLHSYQYISENCRGLSAQLMWSSVWREIRSTQYTHIHTYIHTHIRTYIHAHTYIHSFIHTYVHTHTHIYIYTYTHVHTYTHTHTHTHTHIPNLFRTALLHPESCLSFYEHNRTGKVYCNGVHVFSECAFYYFAYHSAQSRFSKFVTLANSIVLRIQCWTLFIVWDIFDIGLHDVSGVGCTLVSRWFVVIILPSVSSHF